MLQSPLVGKVLRGQCALALIITAAVMSGPSLPMQSPIIWGGGDGPWSGQWLVPPAPQTADPIEFWIDGQNPIQSNVYLDANVTLAGLIVDEGDSLNFVEGNSLIVGWGNAGFINNSGAVRIHASNLPTRLIIGGGVLQVFGPGSIEMDHSYNSRIVGPANTSTVLMNSSTVRGSGIIGDGKLQLINTGIITADRALELLQVEPGPGPVVNSGMMQAKLQSVLVLRDGEYENAGGAIVAHENSYVEIDGSSIDGGEVRSIGQGIVRAHNVGPRLRNVSLSGHLELGLVRLTLEGQILNNGEVKFLPQSTTGPDDYSELFIPANTGDCAINGNGELRLQMSKVFSDSTIPLQLMNGKGHQIRGDGLIGMNTLAVTNHGTVIADRDNPIVFDPPQGVEHVNNGTLRATGLGGFVFSAGTFRNNGVLEVLPGSRCFYTSTATEANITNSALTAGTWRIIAGSDTALLLIPASSIFFNDADVTLSGVGSIFSNINSMLINTGRFAIDDHRNFATQGAFFSNEGELVIGNNCKFTASATFVQAASGTLNLTVGEENLSPRDAKLHVNGSATLGGTVRIQTAPGFILVPGQHIRLVSAGSINGTFHSISAPAGVQIRYESGEVIADVITTCTADLTGDSIVNDGDLVVLLSQWGVCPAPPQQCTADIDGNGNVNVSDMIALINTWGACP